MDIITYALVKKYIKTSLANAGINGASAYEIAVENGFSGSEAEWIASLAGTPGETPYIGANGNWFIGEVDTEVPATPPMDYNNLQNKPTLNGEVIKGDMVIDCISLDSIDELFRKE